MIAEKKRLSERTVSRIFSGETTAPGIDILRDIVYAMGGSLDDIFNESDFKLPSPEVDELKNALAAMSATVEKLTASESLLKAENSMLKDKVVNLTTENDILRLKLEHKEELLALHNYYIKQKSNG